MSMLVDYDDSSGEEDRTKESQSEKPVPIDYNDSCKVFSGLKERFPLDSTPGVPNKVGLRVCNN